MLKTGGTWFSPLRETIEVGFGISWGAALWEPASPRSQTPESDWESGFRIAGRTVELVAGSVGMPVDRLLCLRGLFASDTIVVTSDRPRHPAESRHRLHGQSAFDAEAQEDCLSEATRIRGGLRRI